MRLPVQPLRGTQAQLVASTNTLEPDELAVATDTGQLYLVLPGTGGNQQLLSLAPGVAAAAAYGNTYLKENTVATPITAVTQRSIVRGATEFKNLFFNFQHDPITNNAATQCNGHRYTGASSILTRTIASLSVSVTGNNRKIGMYLCVNRAGTALAETDRLTETEVYQFASAGRNESATIQMLEVLNPNDRVYLRVQNDTTTDDIRVNFFNLVTVPV